MKQSRRITFPLGYKSNVKENKLYILKIIQRNFVLLKFWLYKFFICCMHIQIVSGFIILFPSAILFSIQSNHYSCIEITVFCAHSFKQCPICLLNVWISNSLSRERSQKRQPLKPHNEDLAAIVSRAPSSLAKNNVIMNPKITSREHNSTL